MTLAKRCNYQTATRTLRMNDIVRPVTLVHILFEQLVHPCIQGSSLLFSLCANVAFSRGRACRPGLKRYNSPKPLPSKGRNASVIRRLQRLVGWYLLCALVCLPMSENHSDYDPTDHAGDDMPHGTRERPKLGVVHIV